MALSSTLFCLLLSISLGSGHLLNDDWTTRRPRKGNTEEGRKALTSIEKRRQRSVSFQDNLECQEVNPLGGVGASYLGRMNVTTSGRSCQAWTAQQPHEIANKFGELGEHNYCRNPYPLEGVWCFTTDPNK